MFEGDLNQGSIMNDWLNDIPRRNRLDLNIPAELAIREAIHSVEAAGAHPLLTDAVGLLDQALNKVADWYEAEVKTKRERTDAMTDTPTTAELLETVQRLLYSIKDSRKGHCGDHNVYVAQLNAECVHEADAALRELGERAKSVASYRLNLETMTKESHRLLDERTTLQQKLADCERERESVEGKSKTLAKQCVDLQAYVGCLEKKSAVMWTRTLPTQPGYYWYRMDHDRFVGLVGVHRVDQAGHGSFFAVSNATAGIHRDYMDKNIACLPDGQWAGPIHPPTT